MHSIVKNIIQSYLSTKKVPTISELGLDSHPDLQTKNLSFVTLYKNGEIIASSGRVHLKKENTLTELVDNALGCLQDERFGTHVTTPEDFASVDIRVDIIRNDDRRIIQTPSELDPKTEGYIFLSQNLGKLAVLLPNITTVAQSADELFSIVCKKADVNPSKIERSDYVLFAIRSTVSSSF